MCDCFKTIYTFPSARSGIRDFIQRKFTSYDRGNEWLCMSTIAIRAQTVQCHGNDKRTSAFNEKVIGLRPPRRHGKTFFRNIAVIDQFVSSWASTGSRPTAGRGHGWQTPGARHPHADPTRGLRRGGTGLPPPVQRRTGVRCGPRRSWSSSFLPVSG